MHIKIKIRMTNNIMNIISIYTIIILYYKEALKYEF